jgi:hypothetical protein
MALAVTLDENPPGTFPKRLDLGPSYHRPRTSGVEPLTRLCCAGAPHRASSNLAGKGPAAVGSFAGLSAAGAFDMAGNVREWCAYAAAATGERYILGGSWADAPYALTHADARAAHILTQLGAAQPSRHNITRETR